MIHNWIIIFFLFNRNSDLSLGGPLIPTRFSPSEENHFRDAREIEMLPVATARKISMSGNADFNLKNRLAWCHWRSFDTFSLVVSFTSLAKKVKFITTQSSQFTQRLSCYHLIPSCNFLELLLLGNYSHIISAIFCLGRIWIFNLSKSIILIVASVVNTCEIVPPR